MRKAKPNQTSKQSSQVKSKQFFKQTNKKSPINNNVKGLTDNVPVMQAQLPKKGIFMNQQVNSRSKESDIKGPRMNMDAGNTQFDIFSPFCEFPIELEQYNCSDIVEALNLKKLNRKQQMLNRKQKLINMLGEKSLSPIPQSIIKRKQNANQDDVKKQKHLNLKNQVSFKKDEDQKAKPKKLPNGKLPKQLSSDSNKLKIKKEFSENSEFTISSIDIKNREIEQESNSIISEEDSAFEDTPAATKMIKNQQSFHQAVDFTLQKQEKTKVKSPIYNIDANESRGRSKQPQGASTEKLESSAKQYKRQRTQNQKKDEKSPIVRYISQRDKCNNKTKVSSQHERSHSRLKNNKPSDAGKNSRNDSLQLESEYKLDHLSINFGKNKFIKNSNSKGNLKTKVQNESQSDVPSVIVSSKPLNLSIPGKLGYSSNKKDAEQSVYSLSYQKSENTNSKKNSIDIKQVEQDFKKLNAQTKLKMMQIYLQKPYKVNNISDVKQNQDDQQLYRAENNLTLHTVLRSTFEEEQWNQNKKTFTEFYKDANGLVASGCLDMSTLESLKRTVEVFKAQYTHNSNFRSSSPLLESGQQELSPQRSSFGQKKSSVHDKELEYQKRKLDQNFKKAFYEQLQKELDKRFEIIKKQFSLLKKKSDLFSCYGPNALLQQTSGFNKQQKQEFSSLIQNILNEQQNDQQNIMGTSTITYKVDEEPKKVNKNLQKVNPYLPQKNKKRAIQQIEAAAPKLRKMLTNTSNQTRNMGSEQSDDFGIAQMMEDRQNFIKNISETIGFTKFQIQDLKKRHDKLRQAEISLERQLTKDNMICPTNSQTNLMKGSLHESSKQSQIEPVISNNKYFTQSSLPKENPEALNKVQTQIINNRKLKPVQLFDNVRSPEHNGRVQEYFSNKTDLRRSQEQKLHYEKNKKLRANITIKQPEFAQSPSKYNVKHQRNLTHVAGQKKSILPLIKNSYNQEEIKHAFLSESEQFQSPQSHVKNNQSSNILTPEIKQYTPGKQKQPLKKSITQTNDKDHPSIRKQRDNVIMAYSVPTTNTQFQQHLGFQFQNKSPQNSRPGNEHAGEGYKPLPNYASDVEHVPLKPQSKMASNSSYQNHLGGKFGNSKTSVLLKGCLNQKQRMNKLLNNPSRKNNRGDLNKNSSSHLPNIIQSSDGHNIIAPAQ